MFKKGDIVKFNRTVYGFRNQKNNGSFERILGFRYLGKYQTGMIIGYSFIRTGTVFESRGGIFMGVDDYEPGQLVNITDNKVWLVEPIISTERYLRPVRCLENDIELLQISEIH